MLLELKLKKIRLKERKKLNEKNYTLFKQLTKYIKNSDLRGFEKEEILQQVMDMMLQAQSKENDIDKVIGNDYEEFCQSIIMEYSNTKNSIYKVFSFIQRYLAWLLMIFAFQAFWRFFSHPSLPIGITFDDFMFANAFALLVFPRGKKNAQVEIAKYAWLKPVKFKYRLITIILASIMISFKGIMDIFNVDIAKNYDFSLHKNSLIVLFMISIMILIEPYKYMYDSKAKYYLER